jgi:hypothetical protein
VASGLSRVSGRRRRAAVLAVYVVVSVADVAAEFADQRLLMTVLPLLLMPLLVAYLGLSVPRSRTAAMMTIGLAFAWLGDSFAASPLVKIAFFAITQIAYSAIFAPRWRRSWVARRALLAGYGLPMLVVILAVGIHAGPLAAPVIAYGLLVTVMVALASGVNRLCGAGAVLFLLSDITLGCQLFVVPAGTPLLGGIVMATYLTGQLLITLGVIRRIRINERTAAGLVAAQPWSARSA